MHDLCELWQFSITKIETESRGAGFPAYFAGAPISLRRLHFPILRMALAISGNFYSGGRREELGISVILGCAAHCRLPHTRCTPRGDRERAATVSEISWHALHVVAGQGHLSTAIRKRGASQRKRPPARGASKCRRPADGLS